MEITHHYSSTSCVIDTGVVEGLTAIVGVGHYSVLTSFSQTSLFASKVYFDLWLLLGVAEKRVHSALQQPQIEIDINRSLGA